MAITYGKGVRPLPPPERTETLLPKEGVVRNVGEPVIAAYKGMERGVEQRKKIPEDVKINNPEERLFAVFDGVSGDMQGGGAIGSKVASEKAAKRLGASLDREVKNILSKVGSEQAAAYIETQIQLAVREAHEELLLMEEADPTLENKLLTTLSLAKLVELPGRGKELFIANVGDSRVYILRKETGELEQVTQDDGFVAGLAAEGQVSAEEAEAIDQATDEASLKQTVKNPLASFLFKNRNVVTQAVGARLEKGKQEKASMVPIIRIAVRPGDRLVITSDGVHDNALREHIKAAVLEKDPKNAEANLQNKADALSQLSKNVYGRAKGELWAVQHMRRLFVFNVLDPDPGEESAIDAENSGPT